MSPSRRRFFAVLAAAFLTFGAGDAQDDPLKRWSVYGTDFYQLLYQPEHEADAKKVKGHLDAAVAALKEEFAGFPVADLLRVHCRVYLHPKRNEKASEYRVGITTGTDQAGKYSAEIDLLAASAYDPNYRSNVGELADDDYVHKLVMHEYSTILLERITRAKKAGWRFYDAPRWFTDGYEEYLALTLTSPHNRKVVVGKYLAQHRADPDRIDFDFGIAVKDDYIDGALLMLFLHEAFGKRQVHAVLTSEEQRFGKAMATALGVGLPEFKKRWDEWLKRKLG